MLLHPSVKDWSQTIAAELERKRGVYEIRPIHALDDKGAPVAPKIRYEVGASLDTLNDWTYVLQVLKPVPYGKSLRVPYVFRYREIKDTPLIAPDHRGRNNAVDARRHANSRFASLTDYCVMRRTCEKLRFNWPASEKRLR